MLSTCPPDRRPFYDAALACYRVPLAGGQTAMVDPEDLPKVGGYRWRAASGRAGGVQHGGGRRCERVFLGRLILNATAADRVDFVNDDPLDHRRANLRLCARADANRRNRKRRDGGTSRFKGVSWDKRARKWKAGIWLDGRTVHLGLFEQEDRAAEAYDEAAAKHFGQFARLNLARQGAA